MAYLQIHVHRNRIGEAFDDIRRNDERISWAGFAAKSPRGAIISGTNPLKAMTREHLENYITDCLKSRAWQTTHDENDYSYYFIIRDEPEMEEYATELAFRFGSGIARRSGSLDM